MTSPVLLWCLVGALGDLGAVERIDGRVQLQPQVPADAEEVVQALAEDAGLERGDDELLEVDVTTLPGGTLVTQWGHWHRGVRVSSSGVVVFEDADRRVRGAVSALVHVAGARTTPGIGEEEARRTAGLDVRGALELFFDPSDRDRRDPILVWRFVDGVREAYVDAARGALLHQSDGRDVDEPPPDDAPWERVEGRGETMRDGVQTLSVSRVVAGYPRTYRLGSVNEPMVRVWHLGPGAEPKDLHKHHRVDIDVERCSPLEDCSGGDCVGLFDANSCPLVDAIDVNLQWSGHVVMRWLDTRAGRRGIDNEGCGLTMVRDPGYTTSEYFAGCGGSPNTAYLHMGKRSVQGWLTGLGVVGHESGHALENALAGDGFAAGLLDGGEAKVLAEGLADVVGYEVERFQRGETTYQIGQDDRGICIRNTARPSSGPGFPHDLVPSPYVGGCIESNTPPEFKKFPNTYEGTHWDAPDTELHERSVVVSTWYYLQMEGCTGAQCVNNATPPDAYTVARWQNPNHFTPFLIAFYDALPHAPSLVEARLVSREVLATLFGRHSGEYESSEDAWAAVNVGDAAPSPTEPADGAVDVWPWSVRLKAPVGTSADLMSVEQWEIELDEQPSFSSGARRSFSVTQDEVSWDVEGNAWLNVQVGLKPDTQYHWRVRGRERVKGGWGMWRRTRTFKTAEVETQALSPQRPDVVYPWGLTFTFDKVVGARAYQLQIATDPLFDNVVIDRTVDASALPLGQNGHWPVDVLVDWTFFWQVRALGPDDDYPDAASGWEVQGPISSTQPAVEAIAPEQQSVRYPWEVQLIWSDVPDRSHYVLELAHGRSGFGGEHPIVEHTVEETWLAVDFIPQFSEDAVQEHWRVRVVGPVIETTTGPVQEEGLASDDMVLINDGSKTIPYVMGPAPWEDDPTFWDNNTSASPVYLRHGRDVRVSWKHVPRAAGYTITLHPFLAHQQADGTFTYRVDFEATPDGISVEHDGGTWGELTSAVLPAGIASRPPTGTEQYGFWYVVRAVGVDGSESPVSHGSEPENPNPGGYPSHGEFAYYLRAPSVHSIRNNGGTTPDGKAFFVDADIGELTFVLQQEPRWSPTSRQTVDGAPLFTAGDAAYRTNFFEDSDCTDYAFTEFSGSLVSTTSFGFGQSGSLRSRAHDNYLLHNFAENGGYGPCFPFQVATKDEHRKALCGNGHIDLDEACDDGNTERYDGCSDACEDDYCGDGVVRAGEDCDDGNGDPNDGCDACSSLSGCGQPFLYDEGGTSNEVVQVDIGASQGLIWVAVDTLDIPDEVVVWYENTKLFETNCQGTQGPVGDLVAVNGTDTFVTVEVKANCEPTHQGNTKWGFFISCADDQGMVPSPGAE